jgi:hypothetical protein
MKTPFVKREDFEKLEKEVDRLVKKQNRDMCDQWKMIGDLCNEFEKLKKERDIDG